MENDCHKMYLSKLGSFNNIINFPTIINEDDIKAGKTMIEETDLKKKGKNLLAFDGDFNSESDILNLEYVLGKIWPKLLEKNEDLKLDIFGSNINKRVLELCSLYPQVRPVVSSLNEGHTPFSKVQPEITPSLSKLFKSSSIRIVF